MGDSEEPFALYAERNYSDSCTMRQHYMDIFHAVYWFQTGDFAQAEDYFMRAYEVSEASGLIMPFAEYGEQIVRLLTRGMNNGTKCKQEWVHSVLSMAEQYEESLDSYRA